MFTVIILLPLIGFFAGGLFGRLLGNRGVCAITVLFMLSSFCLSLGAFYSVLKTGDVFCIKLAPWIVADTVIVNWHFCFDSLTVIMLCVVTTISTLVHVYSIEYMANDPHRSRFMAYLSLFTFFMLILVTANNFLQMFVGWEGVGVSSYLLINFWFTRIQANKAAIKAMLLNRVGDFALLIAIFSIFTIFGTLDYEIIFTLVPLVLETTIIFGSWAFPAVDLICLLLFLGAMGKSAQLGLHTWLPDAMEGPTPVSALIHAATMVTAGVFLITRCSYIFEFSQFALNFIVVIGACTAFFAATTGLFQNDIKKIIAYSTCSQLGYMVFAGGLSSYEVSMYHLSNHAFFKALLFLGAGAIIHALADEQDLRKMGGLKNVLPLSYAVTFLGSLALIGFPFLSGFYSKDVILELSVAKYNVVGHFSFVLGTLAAFCTAFYSTRLLFLAFLASPNGTRHATTNVHEGSWCLSLPLCVLGVLSVSIGFISKEIFVGFGTDFWGSAIWIIPTNYLLVDIEFLALHFKLLPLIFTASGCLAAFFIYQSFNLQHYSLKQKQMFVPVYTFFNKKWYFDRLYAEIIAGNILNLSLKFFYSNLDRGFLEYIGPTGLVKLISFLINKISSFQSGFVFDYILTIAISFILVFVWLFNN